MQVRMGESSYTTTSTPLGHFVIAPTPGAQVRVRVTGAPAFASVKVRPLSLGITPLIEGAELCFDAPVPSRISVEFDGDTDNPLLLFIIDAKTYTPAADGGSVIEFAKGVHEPGEIRLHSGDSVYLHEGAVVRGTITADDAKNIAVYGPGCFDVTGMPLRKERKRVMRFQNCENVVLQDFTIIGAETWNVVPAACKNVVIRGVNVISWIMTGDGIDLCGCEQVLVEGCFLRTADDCVAVKAVGGAIMDGCRNIRDIVVRRCVMWNDKPGNAMEIGYETRADEICDIHFSDIDVIHCMHEGWQSGGVFTIHNGDRANIHDISYRNIRVEDARQKLIDFKVLYAKYSKDAQRGDIHDVVMEDIAIVDGAFPPSIMRGWEDGPHTIDNVKIKNLTYLGKRVSGLLDARIVEEMCKNITVE